MYLWRCGGCPYGDLQSLSTHFRRRVLRGRALLVVGVAAVALAGCTDVGGGQATPNGGTPASPDRRAEEPEPTSAAASRGDCQPDMRSGKLPQWAKAGFTQGTASHYVLGERGSILGVVFGHPLTERSTPKPGRQNKIRWIPRDKDAAEAAGKLQLTAVRAADGQTVRREVTPWPGPSVIDMPKAGCWSFTLRWGDHTDTVDLRYGAE